MGKNSWLTAVKRAFRSPNKDSDKKSCRRKVDYHPEDEEQRKTGRKGWLFKNEPNNNPRSTEANKQTGCVQPKNPSDQRHAIAVAAATAKAAEAAVATAKAAMEIIRLTQPSETKSFKQHSAASIIQIAFKGYLARKALIALKGIVKFQALIRGQIVRKQTTLTMRCMRALLRVQARAREQRTRLSHDGGRRSMFAETNKLWERKSRSRDGSCLTDNWRDCPPALEVEELVEAILKTRNEAHEKSLASAFSRQNKILDSDRYTNLRKERESENRTMHYQNQPCENNSSSSRASTEYKRGDCSIKTVEMDSLITSSYPSITNGRKSRCHSPIHRQSPPRRSQSPCLVSKSKSHQIRPSSPRCLKEEKSYSTANTPTLRSTQLRYSNDGSGNSSSVPNYMVATESAKSRIRSQSTPRQRSSTSEYGSGSGSARKRLSYPIPEPLSQNMRSPSFKSVQTGYVGMEEQSDYSCYTESIGGEISTCSTTDLRRWLR